MLKISAFYLDKQKSFIHKKNVKCTKSPGQLFFQPRDGDNFPNPCLWFSLLGVKSTHDMTRHDRKFRVKVCSLEPRCGQLSSIKYFPERASLPVTSRVVAGYMSLDNLRHSAASTYTVKLSDSLASKVAREYSFTRTEGDTMTAR